MTTNESEALGLYVILARDFCDFLDMLEVASDDALPLLYLMLTIPQKDPEVAKRWQELNALGSGPVARAIGKRGMDLPQRPYPDSWTHLLKGRDCG